MALKGRWPVAVLITLLATLPSLCFQTAMNLTMDPLTRIIAQYQYADMSLAVVQRMLRALGQNLSPLARLLWTLTPVCFLLSPFLSLGRHWYSLRILRGNDGSFSDILSRTGLFFKGMGLYVLRFLLILVWGLPGLLLMVLGGMIAVRTQNISVLTAFYPVAMIVCVFFSLRATLTYQLSDILMTDTPEKGVIACLKESREKMTGLRMALFMLMLSFLWFLILAEIATSLLASLAYAAGLVVSLVCSLVINTYMETSICAFYEDVCAIRATPIGSGMVE